MKTYNKIILIFISVITLVSLIVTFGFSAQSPNRLYGEFTLDKPATAKFVQIKPINIKNFNYYDTNIETLGYSEIRVYAHLTYNDYKRGIPFSAKSKLKIAFSHELSGMGVTYSEKILNEKVTSYIDGFAIEKIYGNKVNLSIDADFIPKGDYTLSISYYLLP